MCGGNGMGFVNLRSRRPRHRLPHPRPPPARTRDVHLAQRLGVRRGALQRSWDRVRPLVSSGQETRDDDGRLHGLRARRRAHARSWRCCWRRCATPTRSAAQLARAAELDVPVLALKVGRTESSRAMVTAHSGALAGEHGAYEAVFETYGVHETRHARRAGRHDGALLLSAAGLVGAGSRERARQRRRASALRRPRERPRRSVRGRWGRAPSRAIDARARPRARGGEPTRRVGDRHRCRRGLPDVAARPA